MTQFTAGFITALLLMFVLGTALVLQGLTEKPSQEDDELNWEREL